MSPRIEERTTDSAGIFCEVCTSRRGHLVEFRPTDEDLQEIREAAVSREQKDEKIAELWDDAREEFYDHWQEEHY